MKTLKLTLSYLFVAAVMAVSFVGFAKADQYDNYAIQQQLYQQQILDNQQQMLRQQREAQQQEQQQYWQQQQQQRQQQQQNQQYLNNFPAQVLEPRF